MSKKQPALPPAPAVDATDPRHGKRFGPDGTPLGFEAPSAYAMKCQSGAVYIGIAVHGETMARYVSVADARSLNALIGKAIAQAETMTRSPTQ